MTKEQRALQIKNFIAVSGLTEKELADKLKIPAQQFWDWKRGTEPKYNSLQKLINYAKKHNIPFEWDYKKPSRSFADYNIANAEFRKICYEAVQYWSDCEELDLTQYRIASIIIDAIEDTRKILNAKPSKNKSKK